VRYQVAEAFQRFDREHNGLLSEAEIMAFGPRQGHGTRGPKTSSDNFTMVVSYLIGYCQPLAQKTIGGRC
jgi:hypothetical protein